MSKLVSIVWASPWSLVGAILGGLAVLTGGGVQLRQGIIEFHGGWLPLLLRRVPIAGGASAMTLGHTVIGCDPLQLDRCRGHELVHVRQYERWGVLFVPAYGVASLWVWCQGLDPYRDNPFEVEAVAHAKETS